MVIIGQQVFDIDFLRYILADKRRLLAELPLPVFSPCSALSPVCAEERFLSAVERWIGKINVVFLRHAVLGQAQAFAEVSNLSKGHSALEPQGIPVFSSGRKMGRTSPVFLW